MEDEEDLYDCVYDDEDGGEIYEDLMKTEAIPPPVSPPLFHVTHIFTVPHAYRLTQFGTCHIESPPEIYFVKRVYSLSC